MKYIQLLFFLTLCVALNAQQKPNPQLANSGNNNYDKENITINRPERAVPPAEQTVLSATPFDYEAIPFMHRPIKEAKLSVTKDPENGLPIFIRGTIDANKYAAGADVTSKSFTYLETIEDALDIKSANEEFEVKLIETDEQEITHVRMQQFHKGVKVYGGDVILHHKNETVFLFNGRYYPTPKISNITPTISAEQAGIIASEDVDNFKTLSASEQQLIAHEQIKSELVIYHPDHNKDAEVLAWHVTVIPNLVGRWEYFINATDGSLIHKFSNVCQFHAGICSHKDHHEVSIPEVQMEDIKNILNNELDGPETATALDLFNINRTINVYETGGVYYMIDASRDMFNSSFSSIPNEPVGAIWSIDAFNTSPQNNNFTYDHITSSNNNWNSKTSVSAHFNGGLAFEYFKNTFNRNSINGQGGNIISLINVSDADGGGMDNAFWNGAAMFYGNGDQVFNAPLAKALDVAGHEMSHGVIQATANLEYQTQSGALNESFADIFGAMIDRDDWQVGEEIVNPSFFPTGTMRDLSNPNNGGSSLSQSFWQPANMSEFQNLPNTPQGDCTSCF